MVKPFYICDNNITSCGVVSRTVRWELRLLPDLQMTEKIYIGSADKRGCRVQACHLVWYMTGRERGDIRLCDGVPEVERVVHNGSSLTPQSLPLMDHPGLRF